MLSMTHARRLYVHLYLSAFVFAVQRIHFTLADAAARKACSVVLHSALTGQPTVYGPWERLYGVVTDFMAVRGLNIVFSSREDVWAACPPVAASDKLLLTALMRDLRYTALVRQFTPEECEEAIKIADRYEPVWHTYGTTTFDLEQHPALAALLTAYEQVATFSHDTDEDAWASANVYRDGELHRADGWTIRAKAAREAGAHGADHTHHDHDRAEPSQPDGEGAYAGVLRAAAREHDETRSRQSDAGDRNHV